MSGFSAAWPIGFTGGADGAALAILDGAIIVEAHVPAPDLVLDGLDLRGAPVWRWESQTPPTGDLPGRTEQRGIQLSARSSR